MSDYFEWLKQKGYEVCPEGEYYHSSDMRAAYERDKENALRCRGEQNGIET